MIWLRKYHFDYLGLIDLGMAIKVTEENNSYEKKIDHFVNRNLEIFDMR